MNTRSIQALGIASLLLSPLTATALTFTWDGGGADNSFSTFLNWAGNLAPASNLTSTDLIFAGTVRLLPAATGPSFSAHSVTFNNTAGAFTITAPIGLPQSSLVVGTGGITNNDADTQTFGLLVSAAANQTINAASGALVFNDGLEIGTNNVTLSGASAVTIDEFQTGAGTLTKSNPGPLTLKANFFSEILADLLLNAGTTTLAPGTSTLPQTVGSTGSIRVGAGATFNINEGLTLSSGAQLTKANGATMSLEAGKTLRIESGSDFLCFANHTISGGNVTVTGTGSTIQTALNISLAVNGGSTLAVQSGGSAISARSLDVGNGTNGTLTVDGTGSSVSATLGTSVWGQGATLGAFAAVTFSNNATGTIDGVNMAASANSSAIVQILSGADITNTGELSLSNSGGIGTLLVSGAGTTWQQTTTAQVTIGASDGIGTLDVRDGAAFTTATSPMVIKTTGTVILDGGTLSVGGTFSNSGTLNFNAGALDLPGSNITVGTGGSLGQNLTLLADHQLAIGGTTTVDAFRTLTLDGGSFSTGALVNNGVVDFQRGTLGITGAGGFNIGTGALGGSVTLRAGANLQVTNRTIVATGALLRVDGGSFSGSDVTSDGTIDHRDGALDFTGTLTNKSTGRMFVSGLASPAGLISNAGRITMQQGIGFLGGAGAITNTGLITGDGTIAKPVTNSAGGQIRAEPGKTLTLTGTFATNAGTLSLEGGTLEFPGAVTNASGGFITGRGALHTGDLTNNGVMAFSGGNADIFGDVTNAAGARIVTSGAGATTTFYDDVVHNGLEIFTGANASTVFFGSQSGAGPFTGSGTIYFIGDLRPGSSPAVVTLSPQVIFAPSISLALEIGGRTPGSGTPANNGYDKLVFTGTTASQVTWGGILVIELINNFTPAAGDAFDVFDFDAARDAGAFSAIAVVDHGLLPPGLVFNFSELYTTGIIRVVSTGGTTFGQWAATEFSNPSALPGGDHDGDGYDNLTEYALALLPVFPGASGPAGGLHSYPEGERMRVLFWRHIDRTDITIRVQVSTDLVAWNDLAVSVNSAPFTGAGFVSENRMHPLSEPGLVEVRDILNASGEARRYLRILVTLSP